MVVVHIERRQSRKEHEKYVKVTITNKTNDLDFSFGLEPNHKQNFAFDDDRPLNFSLKPRESFTLIDRTDGNLLLTEDELEAVNHVIHTIRNRGGAKEEWEEYDNVSLHAETNLHSTERLNDEEIEDDEEEETTS